MSLDTISLEIKGTETFVISSENKSVIVVNEKYIILKMLQCDALLSDVLVF